MLVFVTHPYHRGGVTSWIKDAFLDCSLRGVDAALVTVSPSSTFISGKGRPAMVDFVGGSQRIYAVRADYRFELGTFGTRVETYRKTILTNIPQGAILIPSDDDACWAACCVLADKYPVVGVLHSDDPHYYQLFAQYGACLSGVVAVSNRVLKNAGPINLPATVIPCGINMRNFTPGEKSKAILWVGRVEEEQKRVSDLLPICSALRQSHPDWSVEVYGHGDRLPWLRQQQESQQLTNLVLHGWQPPVAIASAMQKAMVLLQTSNYEGMSVAVMEAMASGCAVVSSRVSGVEDLEEIDHASVVVHLYETGDTNAAVNHIRTIIEGDRRDLPTEARTLAMRLFSIESCVDAYVAFTSPLKPAPCALPFRHSLRQRLASKVLAMLRLIKYNITK